MARVLGPMMGNGLGQALLMSAGSPVFFFEWPPSEILMGTAIFLLIFPLIPSFHNPAKGWTISQIADEIPNFKHQILNNTHISMLE